MSYTQFGSAYDPLAVSGDLGIDASFSFAEETAPLTAARAPGDAAADAAPAAPVEVEANQPASYYVRLLAKQAAADDANGAREVPFIATAAADGDGRIPVGIVIGSTNAPLTAAQEQEIRAAVAAVGSGEDLPVNVTPLFGIGSEEEEPPRTWRQKARRRWRRAKVWARANGPDILRVIAVAGIIVVVVGVTVASPFAAIILAGVAFGALAAAEVIAAMRAKYNT